MATSLAFMELGTLTFFTADITIDVSEGQRKKLGCLFAGRKQLMHVVAEALVV